MEILYILLVVLAITRFFGEIAVRLKQPALVGQLISGVFLGLLARKYSATFPILSGLGDNEVFNAITELGAFFLMLLAGIEMHPRQLYKSSGKSFLVALGGMVIPLGLGLLLGRLFLPSSDHLFGQMFFLGVALAITAVPVAVKVLMELNRLDTEVGQVTVSAALFDDIMSLILLAALTGIIRAGQIPGSAALLKLVGQVLLFFAVASAVGLYLLPKVEVLVKHLIQEESEFAILLVISLGFGVLAEQLGLHFIIGAFVSGLFFTKRVIEPQIYEGVKEKTSALTNGFLAPVFFASIGIHLELGALTAVPLFVTVLIVAAVFGKLIGAGVPAGMVGLSRKQAMQVGFAMSARGVVMLIIADIALRAGLFEQPTPPPPMVANLFSSVVIVAIVTTIMTPIVLRRLFSSGE